MTLKRTPGLLAFVVFFLAYAALALDDRLARPTTTPTTQSTLNLFTPPASQTPNTIAILWDKPTNTKVDAYDIYLDNTLVTTTKYTDHTFKDLTPAHAYDISVRARLSAGLPLQSNTLHISTKPQPQVVDITTYRAQPDGKTLNTKAIQSAIDACPSGGLVRIPSGVFRSGALFLKSDVTLHLDQGATLLGSPDPKDYPLMKYRWEGRETTCYASLLNTPDAKGNRWRNIAITGPGTIDANGSALRKNELSQAAGAPGRAVCIRDTDNLYLQDITVRQSPAWCVHPIYCTDVSVNNVSIHTKFDESGKKYPGIRNGDGLDPDSCRDVFIFNSHIASQDDCIAIKSGRDADGRAVNIPSENVRISHCTFSSGFGVAVGSEMAGSVRNVLVEDCSFHDTFSIASVKAPRGRGAVIENITYRDCTLTNQSNEHHDGTWFRGALYVDQFYGVAKPNPRDPKPVDDGTPTIRNITFQNLTLDTVGGNAIYLAGLPERPMENIRLQNISATGAHGFIANNIRHLTLDNVAVEARDGTAMRFTNVR